MKIRINRETVIREAKEWAQSIAVALVFTLIIRTFIVQAFKIPSGSMRPTLIEGDKLFVNKFIYRFETPRRGDIVVFKFPEDTKKDFIKRLVAFEGEIVEIKNGKIIVEGKELAGDFSRFYYYNHDPFGGPYDKIKVPEKTYYVLGSYIDPIADKLLLLSGFLSLSFMAHLPEGMRIPAWVTVSVITRDAIILIGSMVIFITTGKLKAEPLPVGKVTTVLQMSALLASLAIAPAGFRLMLYGSVVLFTVISGIRYLQMGGKMLK